ncbi:methylase [Apilactobacillus kunkeei]|uniref:methylase n=1 Tax=Apilactobacillus kunkeei TaxID=148814 RepID=UPI00110CCF70|nr:methylase [Apilactobacillus kunkeei]TMT01573.1 methylase [Apilactobacillus kunkeei]
MVIKIDSIELFDGHPFQDNKRFTLKQHSDGKLIKSKNRVQKHGEVFTPKWMVKKMLSTPEIQDKIHDLHATFLEPSAGEGAFLTEVLHQKLDHVDDISKKKDWQVNALWALMSIYGIEYLEDNLFKARQAMTDVLINHYQQFFQKELSGKTDFFRSANLVIKLNIVQGDTLKYKQRSGNPIIFNEWKTINKDEVLRVPFTYESLFEDKEDKQLDIFSSNDQITLFGEELDSKKYKTVKVTKVYKGELE